MVDSKGAGRRQARLQQDACRVAEAGDDGALSRTHLHQAGRGGGEGHNERGNAGASPAESHYIQCVTMMRVAPTSVIVMVIEIGVIMLAQ